MKDKTTTDLLDEQKKTWDQTKDDLRLAQHDVSRAKEQQHEVATQLRELGYDPDEDLDGQLREKAEGLGGSIKDVADILANGEGALPAREAKQSEPIHSEG